MNKIKDILVHKEIEPRCLDKQLKKNCNSVMAICNTDNNPFNFNFHRTALSLIGCSPAEPTSIYTDFAKIMYLFLV